MYWRFVIILLQYHQIIRQAKVLNDLVSRNISVWLDRDQLSAGKEDWQSAIRYALRDSYVVLLIASTDSIASKYVGAELELADMYSCHIIPVLISNTDHREILPLQLLRTQYVDMRSENLYASGIANIKKSIVDLQSQIFQENKKKSKKRSTKARNPYKGLEPFRASDRREFFGRKDVINKLVQKLSNYNRFISIIGSSGSGKSSLMLAGLLPHLQENVIENSHEWIYLDPVYPGDEPIENLALVLSKHLPVNTNTVIGDLKSSSRGLYLVAQRIIKHQKQRLVLSIDQFEELFTHVKDNGLRREFLDLIVKSIQIPNTPLSIIITLRADFYHHTLYHKQFGEIIREHNISLTTLGLDELRDVIVKPTELEDVNIEFEDRLVGDLLFDVYNQPGALPLLQFTLDQMFIRHNDNLITRQIYDQIGGVRGALASHANQAFLELKSDKHREYTRQLFLRLIEVGDIDQEVTRRRASQQELVTEDNNSSNLFFEIMQHFINKRLLIVNQNISGSTIEISHEALISEWTLLKEWIHESRENVILQQNISRDSRLWIKNGHREEELYRGKKLIEALGWIEKSNPSRDERDFIEAGRQAASNEEIEAQRIAKELDVANKVTGSLLATVSHEMRTPLNAILGYSELLMQGTYGELTEKASNRIERVFQSGRYLLELVNDILDEAKISNNKLVTDFNFFDIESIITELEYEVINVAEKKDIVWKVDISDNLPEAYGDIQRTRQILLNLVNNAIKFTPSGSITIKVYQFKLDNQTLIRIDVIDTGIGIADSDLDLIFGSFVQLDSKLESRKQGDGLGIGLSLARNLALLQNGDLIASSSIGKGSVFSLLIPSTSGNQT